MCDNNVAEANLAAITAVALTTECLENPENTIHVITVQQFGCSSIIN